MKDIEKTIKINNFKGFDYIKNYPTVNTALTKEKCNGSCATCRYLKTVDWLLFTDNVNDNNFLLKLPSAFCSNPDFELRKVNRYL